MGEETRSLGDVGPGHEVERGAVEDADEDVFVVDLSAFQGPSMGPESEAGFVPTQLLDGDWPQWLTREGLAAACHVHLKRLGAVGAALQLALGRASREFVERLSYRDLGHSREEDFAIAGLGISAAVLSELRALDKRLEVLPRMRATFLAGNVSLTKVRIVAPVATPDDEAGWTELALRRGTRALRAIVKAGRPASAFEAPSADEERDDMVSMTWRCTAVERAEWRGWGVPMLRDILGSNAPVHVLAEALAADTLASFGAEAPDAAEPPLIGAPRARANGRPRPRPMTPRKLARLARRRRLLELPALPPLPEMVSASDAWQGLGVLRALMRLRERVRWERGRLLLRFRSHYLHDELGMTLASYVEHALGISPRDAAQAIDLHARLQSHPSVSAAWRRGDISCADAATLACLVSSPGTESAWLAHAATVSRKRLELERQMHLAARGMLDWQGYLAASSGGRSDASIPMSKLRLDWETLFGVRRHGTGGACVAPSAPFDGDVEDDDPWAGGACARAADADAAGLAGDLEALLELRTDCRRLVSCSFDAPPLVVACFRAAVVATQEAAREAMTFGRAVSAMLAAFAQAHAAASQASELEMEPTPSSVGRSSRATTGAARRRTAAAAARSTRTTSSSGPRVAPMTPPTCSRCAIGATSSCTRDA